MGTEPSQLSIGLSNFRQLREQGRLYLDKSLIIQRVVEDAGQSLLLPRPRRFGKSTNLSTLRYFLEKSDEDRSSLFADLAIWQWDGKDQHFQRYPVIYLSFAMIKKTSWPACASAIGELLANLYGEHRYLLTGGSLSPEDARRFTTILEGSASQTVLEYSLMYLSRYLSIHHGQRVVILVDEYDTPLHEAFKRGYYDDAVSFFRAFLTGGFKDNEHLFKGVLTGILRVARESLFSDLNNLMVYSLLNTRYATDFGFTEAEVESLLARSGSRRTMDELRRWYNGYLFGGQVIYNPWSVLSAVERDQELLQPYWAQTGANDIIRELLWRVGTESEQEMTRLFNGQGVRKPIVESIVLRDIYKQPDALWNFLLFTGYLRAEALGREHEGAPISALLTIPNREVREVFQGVFAGWMEQGLCGSREVEQLSRSLLAGDLATFERLLSRLLLESASYMDVAGKPKKMAPEQVYHVFVLALLIHLQPRYLVRSNREGGHGRYDVLIQPREVGLPGVVMELKVRRKGQTLQRALKEAQEQLRERDYAAELRALGAAPIHAVAVVFDGKQVLVGGRSLAAEVR